MGWSIPGELGNGPGPPPCFHLQGFWEWAGASGPCLQSKQLVNVQPGQRDRPDPCLEPFLREFIP